MGLPRDIYAAVDSCDTAQEIWLLIQQMMKGSDIGAQEKRAKLFNEWETLTSTDGESIESYYHHFSKLMNDFKGNKHFSKKIASNLKFLNNLQPKWKRHIIIVRQIKDLHQVDDTQLYDFLKMNKEEIAQSGINMVGGNGGNQFRQYAGQNSKNQIKYDVGQFARNQNGYNAGNQVVQNAVQNPGIQNVGNQNGLIVVLGITNQKGNGNRNNGNQIRRDATYLQTQLLIAQKEKARIQLQAEEVDLMAATGDIKEIEEINANCILMTNLEQASSSSTQADKAPVYDSDGSAEVHHYENCYNNDRFNMFTQEEQYTELLEPITEPFLDQQNDNNVIYADSNVEHNG
ncbi:hypothetical protein Tco_0624163 [Tanacetum coccineum]|uniref:Gag-Pol polyprotein n=1 Tax=Tanacetum coccineum TaxID=301880 RepID=A0ABQ4WD66_9ASTR